MAWEQIFSAPGNFPLCGAELNGKLYFGGYGSGDIYSYPPFNRDVADTGESIYSMSVFKGALYATLENNSHRSSDHPTTGFYVLGGNGQWSQLNVNDGSAAYCTWTDGQRLWVSIIRNDWEGRTDGVMDLFESTDGVNFYNIHEFQNEWMWIPFVYKNELYVTGQDGWYDGNTWPGGVKTFKRSGGGWSVVSALTGLSGTRSVAHGNAVVEFNGNLYLGCGGWPDHRGDAGYAKVYRYDGTNTITVLTNTVQSEFSALCKTGGTLYAVATGGFKWSSGYSTPDESVLYKTTDGVNWSVDKTVNQAQMRVLFESTGGLIWAGGSTSGLTAYVNGEAKVMQGFGVPRNVSATAIRTAEGDVARVTWDAPEVTTNLVGYVVTARTGRYNDFRSPLLPASPREYYYTPTTNGQYAFRVAAYGKSTVTFEGVVYEATFFSEYSDSSDPISILVKEYTLGTPAAPVASLVDLQTVLLTFASCPTVPAAETIVKLYNGNKTTLISSTTVAALGTSLSLTVVPGESYQATIQYHLPDSLSWSYESAAVVFSMPGSLATPTGVSAWFTNYGEVTLRWEDKSIGEAVFEIWRWSPALSWSKIAEVGKNTTLFIDTSVSIAGYYQYRVVARSGGITSYPGYSSTLPNSLGSLGAQVSSYDPETNTFVLSLVYAWAQFSTWPYIIEALVSYDGLLFTTAATLTGEEIGTSSTSTPTTISVTTRPIKTVWIKVKATNGAGTVVSNTIQHVTAVGIYTAPTPPSYDPGTAYGESLVWTKDGAGEAEYALSGLATLAGVTYAATPSSIGLLDKDVTEAEIITQPLADEWYGGKNVYVAELEASTNRDIMISIGSRSDYKDVSFSYGKEVPFHKTGKTGYFKAGNEFEVTLKWTSGYSHYLKLYGGRLWIKLTKQAMKTVPFFFGKRGYDPGKGA